MTDTSKKKTGSGRTKGAFSFVILSLADLQAKLGADPTTPVKVSRLWAEQLGFKNLTTGAANDLTGKTEGLLPVNKVGVKAVELD